MRTALTVRAAAATLLLAAVLTGCSSTAESPAATGSRDASTHMSSSMRELMADHGLRGMDAMQVVDHLDRMGGDDRPDELMASVRPHELVMSGGEQEYRLDLPDDRFYLSVAPYVDETHECFHHSLTTCAGELAEADVHVTIVDDTHDEVLVDEVRTTFDNGFVGFWLPRDIEGTVRVEYDGKAGEVDISTADDAPTCLTTLRLT